MTSDGLTPSQTQVVCDVEEFLKNLKTQTLLPKHAVDQIYVCLAYEYFIADLEERGFALLKQVTPSYFSSHFRQDIKDDPNFASIVSRIIGKLQEIGLVKVTVLEGDKNEDNNG